MARESFKFSNEPYELTISVAFVSNNPSDHQLIERLNCCEICEWMHSRLGAHDADPWCCRGTCDIDH